MSRTNLTVGERVSLIPFKHKGKIGVVKYIGEIEGKNQGNWVGIELEEAKGDNDGKVNDNQIFECKEGHGIILRPTQVKSLDNDSSKMDQSAIQHVPNSFISAGESMGGLILGGSNPGQMLNLENIDKDFDGKSTNVVVQETGDQPKPVDTSVA